MIKDFLFRKMERCSKCDELNPFFAQICYNCKGQMKTKDEAMETGMKMTALLKKAQLLRMVLFVLIICAVIAKILLPDYSYREVKAVEYNKNLAVGKLCYVEISSGQHIFSLENKAYSNYKKTPAYSENQRELYFNGEGDCYFANLGGTEAYVFVSSYKAEEFSTVLKKQSRTLGAYCRVTDAEEIKASCDTSTGYIVDMYLKDSPVVEFISFDEVSDEEKSGLGPGSYAIIIGVLLLIIRIKLNGSIKWAWANKEALNADK